MLREGWDVQNVTVIVGLRPYTAKGNILPEQTIGPALRLMFGSSQSSYIERVDAIGIPAFLKFGKQLEKHEDIILDTFDLKEPVVITTIAPDPEKMAHDITVPVLSPILARKKTLAEEIASIDVSKLTCPKLPKKKGDAAASQFHFETYDIISLQKLIERDYTIPEPQTAEEVISYYAKRITSQNRYSTSISKRSRAMKASQSAQSWSVISETADLEINSSPVASQKASSTSRVASPLAYISVTRRSSTSELPSRKVMRLVLKGSPVPRTLIGPSAVRMRPSS